MSDEAARQAMLSVAESYEQIAKRAEAKLGQRSSCATLTFKDGATVVMAAHLGCARWSRRPHRRRELLADACSGSKSGRTFG
jgi:hypothetical protein